MNRFLISAMHIHTSLPICGFCFSNIAHIHALLPVCSVVLMRVVGTWECSRPGAAVLVCCSHVVLDNGALCCQEEQDMDDLEPGSRKKIRKIKSAKKLDDTTKAAAKAEEDRRKRVADRQSEVSHYILNMSSYVYFVASD